MSTFSKRVPDKSDVSAATTQTAKITAPKAPVAPAPSAPKMPVAPAVVVSRSVDVGASPQGPRSRPVIPPIAIPPPAASPPPVSKPPALPKPPAAALTPAQPPVHAVAASTVRMDRPPGSVRPPAPDVSFRPPQASIADTFDRMLTEDDLDRMLTENDLDRSLGALGAAATPTAALAPAAHSVPADLTEVRALFAQLAANHVRQVRDFMMDLRSGEATADWIGICDPALRSLRRAAEKLEFTPLCEALDGLSGELATVRTSGARTITGDARAPLLARYEELVRLMPQAFALDLDRSQREGIILQSLLMQVPDVKKVTIDRLYAAGLTTLEAMFLARPGDLVATAGVPEEMARRIVEQFRAYREQIKSTTPDATRAGERERLSQLAAKLRREHDAFEAACESAAADAPDRKRELRKARAQTLLDVQVLLARLGEVDRLAEIERLPFEKKVARLEAFLDEARTTYARPSS